MPIATEQSTGVMLWWSAISAISVAQRPRRGCSSRGARSVDEDPACGASASGRSALSALFVFGCAFRSFLPRAEGQRICLVDSWWSSAILSRAVATVAELSLVAQWTLFLGPVDEGRRLARRVRRLAAACCPLIAFAEICSWYTTLTTNFSGSVIEESTWAVTSALMTLTLDRALVAAARDAPAVHRRGHRPQRRLRHVHGDGRRAHVRGARARRHGARQDRTSRSREGVADSASRRVVTRRWDDWKDEMPWMSLYFSAGVWISLSLIRAPRLKTGHRARERRLARPSVDRGAPARRRGLAPLPLLTAINFVNYFDRQIMYGLFPLVGKDLALSDTALGALGFGNLLVFALSSILSGPATRRFGARAVVATGVTVWSLATLGSALAPNYAVPARHARARRRGRGRLRPARERAAVRRRAARAARARHGHLQRRHGARRRGRRRLRASSRAACSRRTSRGAARCSSRGCRASCSRSPRRAWRSPTSSPRRRGCPRGATCCRPCTSRPSSRALLANFGAGSLISWMPTLLLRERHLAPSVASAYLGLVAIVCGAGGVLAGGYAGDALSRRVRAGHALVVGVSFIASVPVGARRALRAVALRLPRAHGRRRVPLLRLQRPHRRRRRRDGPARLRDDAAGELPARRHVGRQRARVARHGPRLGSAARPRRGAARDGARGRDGRVPRRRAILFVVVSRLQRRAPRP